MVIPLILLAAVIVTTPITVTENAFARNVKDSNQAASVSNTCLNPVSNFNTNDNMISNANC
jgi:hypothetical protein